MRLQEAWEDKHRNPNAFLQARDGDHLHVPFECDLCVFRKLRRKNPVYSDATDRTLLECIRRMILDSFWSRSESTVKALARNIRMQINMSAQVGLLGPFEQIEGLPREDHCGYEVAIGMLLYSTRPDKYSTDHLQYDTVRKLRSSYSDFVRSSSVVNQISYSMGDFHGNYQRLVTDPCGSLWFKRFMEGLRNRMGQVIKPNRALSHQLLLELIKQIQDQIIQQTEKDDSHAWLVFLNYVTVTYVLSLRGAEGFLWKKGGDHCTIIPLLGRFKGEHQESQHLIPCVNTTKSGIEVRATLRKLIQEKRDLGFIDGPAISNFQGKLMTSKDLDEMLVESLTVIYLQDPSLFPGDFISQEDIPGSYQCFRTFRRSAATRAIEVKISKTDMEIVNRWRAVETAAGNRPNLPMHIHYAQVEELLGHFLRFTGAM